MADLTSAIAQEIGQKKEAYLMNTHYLDDYNEIYSTNNYLDERTSVEKEKLDSTLGRLNSTLLRMKQEYLLRKYDVNNYNLKTSILSITLVLVCIFAILIILYSDGKLGKNLLMLIVGGVSLFFILLVVLIVKSNSYRVETNWDAYYWGPVEKKK